MQIAYFKSVSGHANLLTLTQMQRMTRSKKVSAILRQIRDNVANLESCADEPSRKRFQSNIDSLKKQLPIVTWQASFPKGRRLAKEAVPSGLFILDIDHEHDPDALWQRIAPQQQQLGIVYAAKTPSTHGLRLVAECRPEFTTIAECQQWLANAIGTEYDEVCKDWARSSFLVSEDYQYFFDQQIFERSPTCCYAIEGSPSHTTPPRKAHGTSSPSQECPTPHAGSLQTEYRQLPIKEICTSWLRQNGGEPQEGERNTQLYKLALRVRYICDFNEQVMLHNMPRYGLEEGECRTLIRSALSASRGQQMPADLKLVLDEMTAIKNMGNDDEVPNLDDYIALTNDNGNPSLPPIFKEWHAVAPPDFQTPTLGCLLPVLGALGSKLRAVYMDGTLQSPTFQVSLEAPQASGKSFMRRIADYCLSPMIEHDEAQQRIEREYNDKRAELKLLNMKVTQKNKDEILGSKPKTMIRYLPATVSITKFLMRMDEAQGLHCFALAEEIDTVYKSYKKSFSSLSDILRCSFDNTKYGQDYASDTSFSGMVYLYYNTLFSGTPKAMRRFYPDVEDGLVSRVLFLTLPDQFGKPLAQWKEFTPNQKRIVDTALVKLNEISIQGDQVQPDHVMEMDFLNKTMAQWCLRQQQAAVQTSDRTRDTFCRRSAVVGFRAGMLAYFLWDEAPESQKKVSSFAQWMANLMLRQHLLRFEIEDSGSNTIPYKKAFLALPNAFDIRDVEQVCKRFDIASRTKQLIYKWSLAELIVRDDTEGKNKFRKK